jgi:hypothetical protein
MFGSCVPGETEKRVASSGDACADHIDLKTLDVILKEMEEANR